MTNSCGLLSPEEKAFVEQWLTEKSDGDVGCPICRAQEWVLSDFVVAAPIFAPEAQRDSKASYPSVMVVCDGCGYSMFFNATVVGLVAEVQAEVEIVTQHGEAEVSDQSPEESNVRPFRRVAA